MDLFIQHHEAAQVVLAVTAAGAIVLETWATYRSAIPADASPVARLRALLDSLTVTMLPSNRGGAAAVDRGTKRMLLAGTAMGFAVAVLVPRAAPALRWGASGWFGVLAGATLAWLGITLRVWAVATLGRFFQREVVIEPGQSIVRSGPYRRIRHPAYAGNLLMLFGFGVALGSWVGAFAGTLVAAIALLPRIRVEEAALGEAFGDSYREHAAATARLLPGVW